MDNECTYRGVAIGTALTIVLQNPRIRFACLFSLLVLFAYQGARTAWLGAEDFPVLSDLAALVGIECNDSI
jgi:hypothetical protein